MNRLYIFLLMLLTTLALFSPQTKAQTDSAAKVAVQLIPERNKIMPGETLYVAIEETITPHWHTYWVNPGDSGEPTSLEWTLPEGFNAGTIHWPVPEKIFTGPLASYGYKDKITLLQEIKAPDNLGEGPLRLSAQVHLLVCEEICIPESSTHEIIFNDPSAPEQDNSAIIDTAYESLPVSVDWPAVYRQEQDSLVLDLEIMVPRMVVDTKLDDKAALMPVEWGIIENTEKTAIRVDNNHLIFNQKRGERALDNLESLPFVFAYQTSDGAYRGLLFDAAPDPQWKKSLLAAPAPSTNQDNGAPPLSFSAALLFALIGGLILNLMPCVFPILSLKALKLCAISGKELAQARWHSLLYTAGILACFAALAGALVVLRGAGEQIGWGFQLQNPVFVMALSWLLFIIGLSLSGYFEFGANLANAGSALVKGHSYAASFFTGVLAAVVATPCTAPFMAAALGYALTRPVAESFAVFMALGLGLALPYLLLSFVPALRALLPKPGAWMENFRQFLAFPMYLAAAWLVWVLASGGMALDVMLALYGATAFVFCLWVFKKTKKKFWRFIAVVLVLDAFLGGAYMATMPEKDRATHAGWTTYTAASFAELEAGDDPLFVNMTAAWCITCKVNERVALNEDTLNNIFSPAGVIAIKGDWTSRDDEITKFLTHYGRNGVPLYVYYAPRDKVSGQRPDPVVLPQILTPGIVKETIENKQKE